VISRKVAVSGIPNSQRYFEQPDEPNSPPNGTVCAAVRIVVLVPVFVEAKDRRSFRGRR
jgi:hypothetical protein